jgi:glucokinase
MIISDRSRLVAAVDVGGSTTKLSLVSDRGLTGETRTLPTPQALPPRDFLQVVIRELKQLEHGASQLGGIGIAVPGFIDENRRLVKTCVNVPWLVGNDWIQLLEDELGIPAILEVDGNAAGLGEHRFGKGRESRRLLVLALGTGVGCAMLINGEPLRFTGGGCGDWGHIYVGGSEHCSAGCQGCLESVLSVRALGGSAERTRELIQRARYGDKQSIEALRRAGQVLGAAMASMAAVFEPDLVLLTGGISEAGNLIAEPAAQSFHDIASPLFRVPVRKGSLGAAATVAGAAVGLLDS